MEFTNEKNNTFYVVAITGRLDASSAGELDIECDKWLAQDETNVILDLGGVEYISSAGLRSILSSAKKLRAKEGELLFCELEGMVADVFQMSGFAAMFSIFDTKEQALQSS